ncbi:MAG: hypothetical protein AABZ32_06265, partial [Bacteroidota bacterium]
GVQDMVPGATRQKKECRKTINQSTGKIIWIGYRLDLICFLLILFHFRVGQWLGFMISLVRFSF